MKENVRRVIIWIIQFAIGTAIMYGMQVIGKEIIKNQIVERCDEHRQFIIRGKRYICLDAAKYCKNCKPTNNSKGN